MSAPEPKNIAELREFVREFTENLKFIVEHPEVVEAWSPAQRAWILEHLELNLEEMKDLQDKIHKLLEARGYSR